MRINFTIKTYSTCLNLHPSASIFYHALALILFSFFANAQTTHRLNIDGNLRTDTLTAKSIKKEHGTSNQLLVADGSTIDKNSLTSTANYTGTNTQFLMGDGSTVNTGNSLQIMSFDNNNRPVYYEISAAFLNQNLPIIATKQYAEGYTNDRIAYLNTDLSNSIASLSSTVTSLSNSLNAKLNASDSTKFNNRINLRELSSNKSNTFIADSASTSKFPSVKSVKDFVNSQVGAFTNGTNRQFRMGDGSLISGGEPLQVLTYNYITKAPTYINITRGYLDGAQATTIDGISLPTKAYVDGAIIEVNNNVSGYQTQINGLNTVVNNIRFTDIPNLTNAINTKFNTSDTTILADRINKKLNITDTTLLANRINTKLNASDSTKFNNRINLRELSSNKSNTFIADSASTSKFPSVKSVKDFVNSQVGAFTNGTNRQFRMGDGSLISGGEPLQVLTYNYITKAPTYINITRGYLDGAQATTIDGISLPTKAYVDGAIIEVNNNVSGYQTQINGLNTVVNNIRFTDIPNLTNAINTKFNTSDTSILADRINKKLNITDTTALAAKFVRLTGNQTIAGNKTFTGTVSGITKTMVGLGNVDNTSDLSKPISTATQTALDARELLSNKSNSTSLGTSTTLYPTQNAVKTYIDAADATKLSLTDTAALANRFVRLTTNQTIAGNKTFTGTVSGITKTMVGLGNVDNTSDLAKPISTATQTALDARELLSNKSNSTSLGTSSTLYPTQNAVKTYVDAADATKLSLTDTAALANRFVRLTTNQTIAGNKTFTGTVSGITKTMVGLGNVDNTSDLSKPISTATQTALDARELLSNKSNSTSLGTSSTLYPTQNAVKTYVDAADATKLSLTDTAALANRFVRLTTNQTIAGNKTFTGTVSGITKTMVGLGNVDNTSDLAKPISTATQAALDLKFNAADTTLLVNRINTKLNASDTTKLITKIDAKLNITDTTELANRFVRLTTDQTIAGNKTFTGTVSGITKTMVGLGNVDNTSDLAKPISTATQAALDLKFNAADTTLLVNRINTKLNASDTTKLITKIDAKLNITDTTELANRFVRLTTDQTIAGNKTFTGTVSGITKTMVGLGNVDNTSDLAKPISTATQAALDLKFNAADTTLLVNRINTKLNAADTTKLITKIDAKLNITDTTELANRFVRLTTDQTIAGNKTFTGTVSGINKTMVGLGNVDNTSDLAKPISTATQAALDLKLNAGDTATVSGKYVHVSSNQKVGGKKKFTDSTFFDYDLKVGGITIGTGTGNHTKNVAVGLNTLQNNQVGTETGINNSAIGTSSLSANTHGSGNTSLGAMALNNLTTGSNNVALGMNTGGNLRTGNNNIIIGANQNIAEGHHRMNIGGLLFGKNMNGSSTSPAGRLGIGVSDPEARLDVAGTTISDTVLTSTLRTYNIHEGYRYANGVQTNELAIGIKTPTPSGLFEINATGHAANDGFRLVSQKDVAMHIGSMNFSAWTGITLNRNNVEQWFIGLNPWPYPSYTFTHQLLLKGFGAVGISVYNNFEAEQKLHVDGAIKANAGVYASSFRNNSDARLKRNIKELKSNSMSLIKQLHPVEYDKKSTIQDSLYNEHEYGFIAQEVEKILPTIVYRGNDKNQTLSLNYTALVPLLTKALQEQDDKIQEQEAKIKQQEAKQIQLEEIIQQLNARLQKIEKSN